MDIKNIIIAIVIILLGGLIYFGSQQPIPEDSVLPETEKPSEEISPGLPANFVFGIIKEVTKDGFILDMREQGVKEIKIDENTEIFTGVAEEKRGSISDIKVGDNAVCMLSEQGDVAIKINLISSEIKFK